MLYLTQETSILLAIEPVDFRGQIDYLIALCEHRLSHSTRSGQWFVFINRAHTMIRVLCYDENGYWLATKRLSRGRYSLWPTELTQTCRATLACDLSKLLKTCVVSRRKTR
jgi:hypothetical protein